MSTREKAIRLAPIDTAAALECARGIVEPWPRCHALAWVARFAPQGRVEYVAAESLAAATWEPDPFRALCAGAWPIRALVERGAFAAAADALPKILPLEAKIEHPGSRAEALFLLFQAALPGPARLWRPVFDTLLAMSFPRVHWRYRRALRDGLAMISARDRALAEELSQRIRDDRTRESARKRIGALVPREPRQFFWPAGQRG